MTATATLDAVAKKKESPPESAELTAARELVRQAVLGDRGFPRSVRDASFGSFAGQF